MNKIEELEQALAAATPGDLEIQTGPNVCFHEGNEVAVVLVDDSNPEEPLRPTVAEFWPATNGLDKADATLYILMKNTLPDLLEAVRALEDLMTRASNILTDAQLDQKFQCDERSIRQQWGGYRAALAKLR